jgi:hypothetical protein
MEIIIALSTILLLPLIPALMIYKFLPSTTVIKGPFKGLHLDLTGAFGGYFLLVLVSIPVIYALQNNQLSKELENMKRELSEEKSKYQYWSITGILKSNEPEITKIFIDGENPIPNRSGMFTAACFIPYDIVTHEIHLPNSVCFYNRNEGYKIVNLTKNNEAIIDSIKKNISIKDSILMSRNFNLYLNMSP